MKAGAGKKGPRLVTFGEVLWDVFADRAHIGGAPLNVAAHAVRCGLNADIVSRVGADDLGRRALDEIRRLGVGTTLVQSDSRHPTGTVSVSLSATGQPTYTIHREVAWDFIAVDEVRMDLVSPSTVDLFYFGTLAQRSPVSRDGLRYLLERLQGTPTFFDVNLRQAFYTREMIEEGLKHATVVKLNDDEMETLSDLLWGTRLGAQGFTRRLQEEFPVRMVVITQGERGCLVSEGGDPVHYPGIAEEVADAVGAGDAFAAAFLAGLLRGCPVSETARVANRLGAFVVSRRGAVPDYNEDIEDVLRSLETVACPANGVACGRPDWPGSAQSRRQ